MTDLLASGLLIVAALFLLLAGVGVVRMPDVYMRVAAASKASTLGVGCAMVAVSVRFGDPAITTRALAVIAFFLLTAPVAAHMIGRAAYLLGSPLWEGTLVDELAGRYDRSTGELRSGHGSGEPADPADGRV